MAKTRALAAGVLGVVLLSMGLLAAVRESRPTQGRPSTADRPDAEVVLYVDESLGQDLDRVTSAYAPPAGSQLRVVRGPAEDAAAAVLAGSADLALLSLPTADPGLVSKPVFYIPQVLAAPWLSPTRDLALEDARRITAAALNSAATMPPAGAATTSGVQILTGGPAAFTPDLQPVTVNGVLPSLSNIRSGRYPLSQPVYLIKPAGQQGPQATTLAEWLSRPEAAEAFAGRVSQATLTVVGDIMLARGLNTQMGKFGIDWPFELAAPRLKEGDITFANLEAPFGTTGTPLPRKLIWFRARPDAAAALPKAGVSVVTLANNHILDYDTPNFLETLDILDKQGIRHTGGGRTLADARSPVIMEADGIRVAFLGYSGFADIFWDYGYPRRFTATDATGSKAAVPGVAPIRLDLIRQDIAAARQSADIVVVAYHWGTEYVNVPSPDMVALAHASVDAGADLVLGFHPHAVQGFERYKGKYIAYSLGNFIMDQKRDVTRESMILEFLLQEDGVRTMNVVPAMIEDYRPHLASGDEATRLWDKLRRISRQIPAPAGMAGASGPPVAPAPATRVPVATPPTAPAPTAPAPPATPPATATP